MSDRTLSIYFVLGEESGDILAAALHPELVRQSAAKGYEARFYGLAGPRLEALGMRSLFDIQDISVMGIVAVAKRLPIVIRRVYTTVADIVARKPDIIVLVDSPDFTHAVAKRIRRKLPGTRIINYVCPSVWAWRPKRATKMKAYIDHVLTLLPFEPEQLERLGGPPGTYVGHPMIERLEAARPSKALDRDAPPLLLVLPGSRNSEIKHLLPLFGRTLEILRARGVDFHPILPAVPHLRPEIEVAVGTWPIKVELVNSDGNDALFAQARAALIASGTVSLELALQGVPHVSGYVFDIATRQFLRLVNVWSSLLPNLIADRFIVPEELNGMVMPERMARYLEALLEDTALRKHQIDGFHEVAQKMKTDRPPAERAAQVILSHISA